MPRKTRVLIVEDDPSFREALTKLLVRLGHDARAVGTVKQALAEILNWEPSGVVLDLVLPDDSGVVVLHSIRERKLPIKVAVVTGLPDAPLNPEFRNLKPDAFFSKPIDIFTLAGWLAEG